MSLTHGPLLGFGDTPDSKIKIWCRGDANETYEIKYSVNSDLSDPVTTLSGKSLNSASNDGCNSIEIIGLIPDQVYYYTPVVNTIDEFSSNFPTFKPLPASPVGETIVFGACISEHEIQVHPGLTSSPPVKLMNYAKDTLDARFIVMLGDTIYAEDPTTVWDYNSDATTPPVAHFQERYRDTYAIAAIKNCLGSVPCIQVPSDHEVFSSWPDQPSVLGLYTHPASLDDPTLADAYANSKASRGYYVENFALAPNAGSNLYGSFSWGNYEIIVLDSRTHRHPNKGKCLGETQKGWLLNKLAILNSSKTALIFTGDNFAIDDGLNGDGWESDNSTMVIGYIAERDQIDSAARKSSAKVHFFGGDRHMGIRGTTKGNNLSIATGPFDDSNQRTYSNAVDRVIKSKEWSSNESLNVYDNRMCAIVFNTDGTITVNHYRAGEAAGGAAEDVIELDDTVTI